MTKKILSLAALTVLLPFALIAKDIIQVYVSLANGLVEEDR